MHFKQITNCTDISRHQQAWFTVIYKKKLHGRLATKTTLRRYSSLAWSDDDTMPAVWDELMESFDIDIFKNCNEPGGMMAAQLNDGSAPAPRLRNAITGTVTSFASTCCRAMDPANASGFWIPKVGVWDSRALRSSVWSVSLAVRTVGSPAADNWWMLAWSNWACRTSAITGVDDDTTLLCCGTTLTCLSTAPVSPAVCCGCGRLAVTDMAAQSDRANEGDETVDVSHSAAAVAGRKRKPGVLDSAAITGAM